MMIKRTIKNGVVMVSGRKYKLDIADKSAQAEGQSVWVDDEHVFKHDSPEQGLCSAHSISIFWPSRYNWLTNATLNE